MKKNLAFQMRKNGHVKKII